MSVKITRTRGAFHDLEFEMDLSSYGKTASDIVEMTFSVKDKLTDPDDSLFLKKLTLSEISISGTNIVSVAVQWPYNEYAQFNIGQIYKAGLFATFTGDPVADENVNVIWDLEIDQDFLTT